jgi:hypothetical protein
MFVTISLGSAVSCAYKLWVTSASRTAVKIRAVPSCCTVSGARKRSAENLG